MLAKLLTTSNKDLTIELLNVMLFKPFGKNSTIIFQPSLVLVENLSILWKIKERSLLDMDYDHKSDFISFIINTKKLLNFQFFKKHHFINFIKSFKTFKNTYFGKK